MILIRKIIAAFGLILLITNSFAQTEHYKTDILIGGGPQDYISELGHGFTINSKEVWHGAVTGHLGIFINKSLDIVFSGTIGDLNYFRLTSVGLSLKYKMADGYFLSESSILKPYLCVGGAFNNVSDRMEVTKVNNRNYMSLNAVLGISYYLGKRFSIGYSIATGYFLRHDVDFIARGGKNELYIHNAVTIAYDFW